MKYFIALPLATNKTEEAEVYEIRMNIIHELKAEGHSIAYTIFEGDWWSKEKMKDRGIKDIWLHYLAKAIEELSKCDGLCVAVMEKMEDIWNKDPAKYILVECAKQYQKNIITR